MVALEEVMTFPNFQSGVIGSAGGSRAFERPAELISAFGVVYPLQTIFGTALCFDLGVNT
jgi:hypothetical protein